MPRHILLKREIEVCCFSHGAAPARPMVTVLDPIN
jgi:hypothetical protein